MLGKGKEYFGFASNPLQMNAPAVWLPYTVLDRLMMELDANSNDSTYRTVSLRHTHDPGFLQRFQLLFCQRLIDS